MIKNWFLFACVITIAFSGYTQNKRAELLYKEANLARDTSYFIADSLIKAAIELAESEDPNKVNHSFYYLAAKIQFYEGFYEDAQLYYEKAIAQAQKQGDNQKALHYRIRLSDNFLSKGNLADAVKLSLETIEKAKETNDTILVVKAYGSLAEAYRHFDHLDLALKYNKLAIQYAIPAKDEDLIARSYNNLSAVLGEMELNYEAIDSLTKGLRFVSNSNLFARAKFNSNIGYCYRNLGEYQKALEYHRKALSLKNKASMDFSLAYSLGAIGRAHSGLGNKDSAIFYIQQEVEYANRFKNIHQIRDAVSHLSDVYAEDGDYEKAYKFFLQKKEIEDSLYEVELEQKALLYQRKFDLALKEKEIERLKNEQLLKASEQENKILLLAGLFILACLIALLFRYRSIKKQREKERIEVRLKNSQLKAKENKKALADFTKDLMLKNKAVKNLSEQLRVKEKKISELQNSKSKELQKLSELKILTEEDWKKFKFLFEKVYPNFFARLNASKVQYTKGEIRLIALMKLNMGNSEIADTLGISSESVSKSRSRLKKKLETYDHLTLQQVVFEM